ncbi:MAG: RNAase P [Candidatus Aenigmatarchaeota archaeon]
MRKGKRTEKRIAQERIEKLFSLAQKEKNHELANRYARLIWRLCLRYNIRLGKEQKRRICRRCQAWLVPGRTARIRARPEKKVIVLQCLRCGWTRRYPYKKIKK